MGKKKDLGSLGRASKQIAVILMTKSFYLTSVIMLFLCCNKAEGQDYKQKDSTLQLHNRWTIIGEDDLVCKGSYHIDSYKGIIHSYRYGFRLQFSVSDGFQVGKGDCSLAEATKMYNSLINRHFFDSMYNIPTVNKIYLDTINERLALIIEPKLSGNGKTAISIINCSNGSSLYITADNLNTTQQAVVKRMFQTIFYKELSYKSF